MLNYIKRFWRSKEGTPSVEFALYLPILVLILVGVSEFGRAVMQSTILEKSLRSGALYAARSNLPLSAASLAEIQNVVQNGNPDGTGNFLIDGWGDTSASITISVSNYTLASETSVLGSNQLPVITIDASVPYQPILGDIMAVLGMGGIVLNLSHEQAHIGV